MTTATSAATTSGLIKITATKGSTDVEPISVLLAELTNLVMSDNPRGFVGFMYKDPNNKTKPTHEVWTDGTFHLTPKFRLPVMAPSGSQNYNPVADSVLAIEGDDKALSRFHTAYYLATNTLDGDVSGVRDWMGTECGLGIYFPDHFCAWFAAYLGGSQVAKQWVEFALAIVRLCYDTTTGRVMPVGQRGAKPGRHKPNWNDALADVVFNGAENVDRWRAGVGWPNEWKLLDKWKRRLRTFGYLSDLEYARALVVLSPMYTRVPWTWGWKRDGRLLYTYQHHTINANTPAMLGAVPHVSGDGVDTMPWNGGPKRVRSKSDKSTCELSNDRSKLMYNAVRNGVAVYEELHVEKADIELLWEGINKSTFTHNNKG